MFELIINQKKDVGITSIKGECVKSADELFTENFLFSHGLDYSYEEVHDEIISNNRNKG